MTVSNIYGQKSKYRITLELDVLDDFNPRQINWRKVLQIEENEIQKKRGLYHRASGRSIADIKPMFFSTFLGS